LAAASPAVATIDLNAALAGVEESIRRSLPGDIKLRLSLHRQAPLCRGEVDCVSALVRLLVAEAASDMPKGGEVVIGTRQFAIGSANTAEFPGSVAGNYLRLTVRDNGGGLPAERLSKIFYPLETARPGAAAAWRLTRRLGAFATVESAEGVGTAVHLYFCAAANRGTADMPVAADFLHAAE
jgi:signal transduction histidine kinase